MLYNWLKWRKNGTHETRLQLAKNMFFNAGGSKNIYLTSDEKRKIPQNV